MSKKKLAVTEGGGNTKGRTSKCILSNKMHRYTVYLHLENALHVSGGTSTHHQERMQLYLQNLVFVTQLLLPAAGGR
jgi:hypothetical protein